MKSERLVLASRSPQRRSILGQLRVEFEVVVPDVSETVEGPPEQIVVENARRKARAVEAPRVLGVDTAVAVDGGALGKPHSEGEAAAMLRLLAGRPHEVWSGITLREGTAERSSRARTRVWFRRLGQPELDWYLATGEWRDRAGAYAIQARGAALVERIEGDFFTVVGLPVRELVRLAPDLFGGD